MANAYKWSAGRYWVATWIKIFIRYGRSATTKKPIFDT